MANEPAGAKFRVDTLQLDADVKIDETSEYLTVHPVTLTREDVFPYEDGRAYKPGDELAKAAEIPRMYLAWDHPPLRVITHPSEIKGSVDNIHVERDGKGVKVKGTLIFHKKRLNDDQIELIRSKNRRDVSVGFYYREDRTPGKWNGQPYDYAQRDLVFDHTASVDHGRCSYPACGIGADKEAGYEEPKRTSVDAAAMLRQLRTLDRSALVALHARIHAADDFMPESLLHRAVLFALKKSR